MLKPAILFMAAAIPMLCIAQKQTYRQDEGNGREYIRIAAADSIVLEEGYLQDGLTDGVYIVYDTAGYPKQITAYAKGKKQGIQIKMADQNTAQYIEHYKANILHGERRVYNSNKLLVQLANYVDGKLHGTYRKYHDNGTLAEKGVYDMGQKQGQYEKFYANGNREELMSYQAGQKHGLCQRFYETAIRRKQ